MDIAIVFNNQTPKALFTRTYVLLSSPISEEVHGAPYHQNIHQINGAALLFLTFNWSI